MRYRLLGRTGLKVSELCLGTMTFGGGQTIGGLGQTDADRLVARALDAGVNFFDTADVYSGGEAERMLGRALGARRKDIFVATKVRLRTEEGPNDIGLSRGHILDAVDASLRRLGTDYIDLYQIHIVDALTPLEETLRAFEDLVRWGKVRYIGCCNLPAWQIMKALAISDARGWVRFTSLQAHYTTVERGLERELAPLLSDQGLGLLVWSPLSGGLLSGKFTRESQGPEGSRRASFDFPPVNRERAFDVVDVMREIASDHDVSVARIALAWLLHQDVVTSVIIGAKRLNQLEDNLLAPAVQLSDEDLKRLDRISALPSEYPGWMLTWSWDDRM
jgi:aryl-alcohol dehydrogenase-like predicted oxidoreductase